MSRGMIASAAGASNTISVARKSGVPISPVIAVSNQLIGRPVEAAMAVTDQDDTAADD